MMVYDHQLQSQYNYSMPLEQLFFLQTPRQKKGAIKWLPRQELLQLAYGEEFGKTGHHLAGHEVPLRWPGGDWYR